MYKICKDKIIFGGATAPSCPYKDPPMAVGAVLRKQNHRRWRWWRLAAIGGRKWRIKAGTKLKPSPIRLYAANFEDLREFLNIQSMWLWKHEIGLKPLVHVEIGLDYGKHYMLWTF